jgi:hypothetical protein
MTNFASGKHAHGFCDRCGFRVPLWQMQSESVRGRTIHNRVCPTCFDPDHPQNFQGQQRMDDPQAIRDARPDPSLGASRELTPAAWTFEDLP